MDERAPDLREEWRKEALGDPVTAASIGAGPDGAVLVFAFITKQRGAWTVLEQPTRALELARMIVKQAERRGWTPQEYPTVPPTVIKLEAPVAKSHAWVFSSAVILTFQLSNGQDRSFLLPSSLALVFALRVLQLHAEGSFVDLNSAVSKQNRKH